MRMINPILNLGKTGLYEATYLVQCQSSYEIDRARQFFASYPWVSVVGICCSDRFSLDERNRELQIPAEIFNAMDKPYYEMLEHLLRTQQFDLIQVEHSWMSWVVPLIRTVTPNMPVVLDMLDIEFKRLERWLQYDPHCDKKDIKARFMRMQRWEKETWQWYDACFAVSPLEAQEYREATVNRIQTFALPVSGGTDIEKLSQPISRKTASAESIVNIGTLIWYPNVHGLLWFIDEAMPILLRTHPRAHLYIAGFGGSWLELMERIKGRKDIVFLGELTDEREILQLGRVFIAPLWIAAGARIKILTAWAAGIPVVATTIAAEGLHYTNFHDILIANDPPSFAEAISKLFDDPELALKLIENGKKLIQKQYSSDCAARQYAQAYTAIVDTHPRAGNSALTAGTLLKKEREMRQLVQLKANLQSKTVNVNTEHGFPSLLIKPLSVLDKSLPPAVKKTYIYYLSLAAFKTINGEGWRVFFGRAHAWLQRSFSQHKNGS